jgi:RNA polymerase sigma factor (sigma-70 family)
MASQGACLPESVRELTGAIASGNAEAFSRFYRRWFERCLTEARRCTGRDEHFCMDAVQETMLRVIRHLKPLDSEAALAAWLHATVRSACIDLLRRDLRRRRREESRLAATHEDGHDHAIEHRTRERIDWLRAQLAALPADQARLLHMRFRLGWTLSRIAQAAGLKTGAVDGRINRILTRLRSAGAAKENTDD